MNIELTDKEKELFKKVVSNEIANANRIDAQAVILETGEYPMLCELFYKLNQ